MNSVVRHQLVHGIIAGGLGSGNSGIKPPAVFALAIAKQPALLVYQGDVVLELLVMDVLELDASAAKEHGGAR